MPGPSLSVPTLLPDDEGLGTVLISSSRRPNDVVLPAAEFALVGREKDLMGLPVISSADSSAVGRSVNTRPLFGLRCNLEGEDCRIGEVCC